MSIYAWAAAAVIFYVVYKIYSEESDRKEAARKKAEAERKRREEFEKMRDEAYAKAEYESHIHYPY